MDKKNATREKLLSVADSLFREMGYDNVSVQDICNVAGIAKPTFYYYFASKEELLSQYIKPQNIAPYPELRKIFSEKSYWKQLWMLNEYSIKETIKRGRNLTAQTLKMILNTPPASMQFISQDSLSITLPLIEEAQKAGEILNLDPPEKIIEVLWLHSQGTLMYWCINEDCDIFDLNLKGMEAILNVHPDFRFKLENTASSQK